MTIQALQAWLMGNPAQECHAACEHQNARDHASRFSLWPPSNVLQHVSHNALRGILVAGHLACLFTISESLGK